MANYKNKGQLVLLDSHIATGTETSYTYTPPASLSHPTYTKLIIEYKMQCTAALKLQAKINADVTYWEEGYTIIAGTFAGYNNTNVAIIELAGTATIGANIIVQGTMEIYLPSSTMANEKIQTYSHTTTSKSAIQVNAMAIGIDSAALTSLEILVSTSSWMAGSTIDIYGVRK